uniref:Small basic protein n=1 Tax=Caliciviridae sp. TaxID=1916234 RepID=A0A6M9Z9Z9_9CALI|nr:MAG: small basic protein [Caliciviridae sp.]
MATAIAAIGAGSSLASASSGLISSISDPIFRAQELSLANRALNEQVKFNQQSLQLAAISPYIQANASVGATEQMIRLRQRLLSEVGASQAQLAAVAAGQEGVYVNGMLQPLHYDNSMFNNASNVSRRGVTYSGGQNTLSLPSTTINKTTTNNITRNYEAGYRQARNAPSRNGIPTQWRPTSQGTQTTGFPSGTYNSAASGRVGSYDVNNTVTSYNSAASGVTGHYSINNTARTNGLNFTVRKGEANALLNNWYQFGFLAPGGTRL